jgi:hypothetical protein
MMPDTQVNSSRFSNELAEPRQQCRAQGRGRSERQLSTRRRPACLESDPRKDFEITNACAILYYMVTLAAKKGAHLPQYKHWLDRDDYSVSHGAAEVAE